MITIESLTINNGLKPGITATKHREILTEQDELDADDVVKVQGRRELLAREGDFCVWPYLVHSTAPKVFWVGEPEHSDRKPPQALLKVSMPPYSLVSLSNGVYGRPSDGLCG